jgi:hypothetical protein
MMRYNLLFLMCTALYLGAADVNKKNTVELNLVMCVGDASTKIPFNNDEFETVPTLLERYRQNESHSFGKVMVYALHEGKVCEVGRIARLQPDSLVRLNSIKSLFISYFLNQEKKPVQAIFVGTSQIKDVNLFRKYIEGAQEPVKKDINAAQPAAPKAETTQQSSDGFGKIDNAEALTALLIAAFANKKS